MADTNTADVPEVVASGFAATESPRWHEGRLYFVDMNGGAVHSMTESGELTTIADLDDRPGGIGWLPDGQLLVVSQERRQVLRLGADGLVLHADLSGTGTAALNDMHVASDGTAYVGDMGFDIHEFMRLMAAGESENAIPMACAAPLWRVTPEGYVHAAADEVRFANGIVAGPGASQVLVAESFALALTLFDVAPDRSLTNPRLFAQLAFAPDGLTMDAEGCAWVADPTGKRVVRIAEGGQELQSIAFEQSCLSVALGGHDLRTLYVCTTDVTDPEQSRRSRGSRIETVRVNVPAVG